MSHTIGGKNRRQELKGIWNSLLSLNPFKRRTPKFYTTFTRRFQLIQQVRTLKENHANDLRKRLNVEYK